jgi:DNA-binding IclR family transcriptional regulator
MPVVRRFPEVDAQPERQVAAGVVAIEVDPLRVTEHVLVVVVDPRRLAQILAEVRRRRYAATDEELEEGISLRR